jgi:hypothetical protein
MYQSAYYYYNYDMKIEWVWVSSLNTWIGSRIQPSPRQPSPCPPHINMNNIFEYVIRPNCIIFDQNQLHFCLWQWTLQAAYMMISFAYYSCMLTVKHLLWIMNCRRNQFRFLRAACLARFTALILRADVWQLTSGWRQGWRERLFLFFLWRESIFFMTGVLPYTTGGTHSRRRTLWYIYIYAEVIYTDIYIYTYIYIYIYTHTHTHW